MSDPTETLELAEAESSASSVAPAVPSVPTPSAALLDHEEKLPALAAVVEAIEDAGKGRPRSPDIEARALAAALDVYVETGWSGFTLGKVAKRARIGKSALYLRWSTKEAMLAAAFTAQDVFFEYRNVELPEVPFIEYVQMLVIDRLTRYYRSSGLAVIRLILENQTAPEELGEIWRNSVGKSVIHTRDMIRNAMVAGDLRPDTQRVQVGDALEGGMSMHVLATPHELIPRGLERLESFADELVAGVFGPWVTKQAIDDLEARGSERALRILPLIRAVRSGIE